jgi:hypothetical protein
LDKPGLPSEDENDLLKEFVRHLLQKQKFVQITSIHKLGTRTDTSHSKKLPDAAHGSAV